MRDAKRKQLVGLLTENRSVLLEEGAQIVADPQHPVPVPMIGHVTSAYHSAALGRSIALAMIQGGRGRIGEKLHVAMPEGAIPVEVVRPVFLDPEGKRLHG
jgi:sarcosine oxidase subunit alpha